MTAQIRLRPEAEQDLADAAAWYEEQRPGLGQEFLDEARVTLSTIAEMPSMYGAIHRSTRRALMHRFPFGIFYRVEKDLIIVLAVLHGSRHPRRWKSRSW
jgi:plasmid stabilization system protein ParE